MTYDDILLTADFDRTLTAPDSTVPARNRQAILDFMALGGTFTVNTGRSVPMYAAHMSEIPVNAPLLLYNGALAMEQDTGNILFVHTFSFDYPELLHNVMERFSESVIEVQGLRAHYVFRPEPMWEELCRQNQCAFAQVEAGADLGPFLKLTLYARFGEPTISSLFSGKPEVIAHMDQVEQGLREMLGAQASIYRAAPEIIDIQTAGVSKAIAARELQRRLGKKLLICVGDEENDIPMLEEADYAFCPADGSVAARFSNVCACAEGAVADVIYEKIPQILAQHP